MTQGNSKILSRRNFFRIGLGAAGTLAATHSLAQICGIATGDQPIGPFFPQPGTPTDPIHEDPDPRTPIYLANDSDLTVVQGRPGRAEGQVAYVRGKVMNENCDPVANATLIIWQASASGRYNHTGDSENEDFIHPKTGAKIQRKLDPHFQYWGKARTNANGEYLFKTIVPGFYPADLRQGWYRPPHIHFLVSATGFPQLVTQMYFSSPLIPENDFIQELNLQDGILQSPNLTDDQRAQLVVGFDLNSEGVLAGEFNITLKK